MYDPNGLTVGICRLSGSFEASDIAGNEYSVVAFWLWTLSHDEFEMAGSNLGSYVG